MSQSRRAFSAQTLRALAAFGLIEGLWARDLLAASVRPTIGAWLRELVAMTRDLRGRHLTDLEFQGHMEELFARVDLAALTRLIKLDEVERRMAATSSVSQEVGLRALDGLPAGAAFNRRIFACARGRSIVPHGHHNLCSGFLIVKGAWRGRHYERLALTDEHMVLRPTIDRTFGPGDVSTISDHKDNVHWFVAESEAAYIFNVHVAGYDPTLAGSPGRLYVDPDGEALADGAIRAARMTGQACREKYG